MIEKQHILDEIKRTAEVNNGVPLGMGHFLRETGIKRADWEGKFWPRWSDAVKDAGYEPNPPQGAYSNDFLIEKLIAFIRELGHFPLRAEQAIKSRNDALFPSPQTLQKRFGTRQQVAVKVIEYCRQHTGFDDVLQVCEARALQAEDSEPQTRDDVDQFGFVYLLKSGRYYKIGKTNAAGRRERELAIQLPEKANMVHVIKTDDPAGIEAYWQRRFESRRKNGEWFELGGADVSAFKRRKFM
jgi:Meiotically up-regulated gene 113